MTLFVDAAGEKGIPSFEMMVIRCIIQLFYSLIACACLRINPFGTKGNRKLPVLRGILGPLSTGKKNKIFCSQKSNDLFQCPGALYYGATKINIADATVLKFTSPIWTLIIARVILKEPITLLNAFAVLIGFTGVLFVAQPSFIFDLFNNSDPLKFTSNVTEVVTEYQPGTMDYTTTVLVCLLGAVFSASVYVVIKKSGGSVHFQVLVFYYSFIGSEFNLFFIIIVY